MPIISKGVDIKDRVMEGTNVRTKDIKDPNGQVFIRGAPFGQDPGCDWVKPSSFDITVGGKDLSNYYTAKYEDFYNYTDKYIPENVNGLKVICIGGGGGGGGGASAHDNRGHGGTAGGGGGAGATSIGYIPVDGANRFKVIIGLGGSPSNSHYYWGSGRYGAQGSTGGSPSYVQISNSQIVAQGGNVGEDHKPMVRHGNPGSGGGGWANDKARLDKVFNGNPGGYSHRGGAPGKINQGNGNDYPILTNDFGNGGGGGDQGGNNTIYNAEGPIMGRPCYGKPGQQGMCRVYYLY
jgi:hypothetical protein